tara:strand:+ start:2010 stop:2354 length:345 start_codon:yes stop_codon:yes gene_type:complete
MNHSQTLQSNSEEIKALLEENKDKTKQEVKLLLMKTFKCSDKTAGRYYDRFTVAEYPILELNDNKKELNTKITRALIGIVDDVNTLSCETTEEIKEQLELLDIAAKVTNNIKTY